MELATFYIVLATAFGLFMAWGIGANDASNAMAPSVGSRAINIRQAIVIAAIFEFAGAVLAGGGVTSTIRKGLVDTSLLADQPELLVFGMLASLLAAGTWLLVASARGWPVAGRDRKSTRLNSSHVAISYAVFCLKKKNKPLKDGRIKMILQV